MKLKALSLAALGVAAFVTGVTPQGEVGMSSACAQAEGVRPEVGKHLQAASALIKSKRYAEALAKVRDAEGVAGRNATENATIEQMRVAAAQGAGDPDQMAKGFEALKASGRLPQASQLSMMEAIAITYLQKRNTSHASTWTQRYFREGGTSDAMRQVQAKIDMESGDWGAVMQKAQADVAADERAGRVPAKSKIETLLFAARKKGDANVESQATEKLLNNYPSKELWTQFLTELPRKKSFSDRFGLDIYRLKLATGNMRDANDYMEMAQLSGQAGYPEEGKMVMDKGFAAGVLGQGAEGVRHKRMQDFLAKKIAENKAGAAEAERAAMAAKDGNQLVQIGLASAFRGEAAKGVQQIQEAIEKDALKRPEDAKLYLGMAYYLGGNSAKAQAAWRTVRGTDGSAELARLWIVQSRSGK